MAKITADNRGITMLEVIVVVAIISILAVVARPSAKAFLEGIRLWSAANSIKQELVLAKTRALGDPNVHAGVYFDTASRPPKLQTFIDDDSTALNDYLYTSGKDHLLAPTFSLPATDTLKILPGGTNPIVFRGDGSTKAPITVVLSNGYSKRDTLTILPSTGRIRIGKNF